MKMGFGLKKEELKRFKYSCYLKPIMLIVESLQTAKVENSRIALRFESSNTSRLYTNRA